MTKNGKALNSPAAQTVTLSLSIFCHAQLAVSNADEEQQQSQKQRQHQHIQIQLQTNFSNISRWSLFLKLFLTLLLTFTRLCVANDAKQKMD